MLQSLAVNEIGQLADRLRTPTLNADGTEITYSANATSEGVRALLQGLAGCAGQAIGGGDCAGGAFGGAGSVAANLLLNALSGRGNNETVAITRDANGNIITPENPVNPRWTCNGLVPVTCLSLCHLSFKSQGAYAAQI